MIRYSSTKLESLRFDTQPSPRDRRDLKASGWEPHLYEPRLYIFRHEVKPVRLSSISGFVLSMDGYGPEVLAELFSGA